MSANEKGKLCFKNEGTELVYKQDNGNLVYKAAPQGKKTMISFSWSDKSDDLDIYAYWRDASEMSRGYMHDQNKGETTSGVFKILQYSGDVQGTGGTEFVSIYKTNWKQGSNDFIVHLKFYREGTSCTVIATQLGGKSLRRDNVPCSSGGAAQASDPGVVITFDTNGQLSAINLL